MANTRVFGTRNQGSIPCAPATQSEKETPMTTIGLCFAILVIISGLAVLAMLRLPEFPDPPE